MAFKFEYEILKPIQLPWEQISPTDEGGLEYHLSPELSLVLGGIISGDKTFNIADELIALEGMQVNGLTKDEVFQNEFMANKTKERISRFFKDGKGSCYFNTKQMTHLKQLFSERNFMCFQAVFYLKGHKVELIEYLGPKDYVLAKQVMIDLDLRWVVPRNMNAEQFEKIFTDSVKENAGKYSDARKESMSDKFKNKKLMKRMLISVGCVVLGAAGLVMRNTLANSSGGPWAIVGAVIIGALGIMLEAYGRETMFSNMQRFGM